MYGNVMRNRMTMAGTALCIFKNCCCYRWEFLKIMNLLHDYILGIEGMLERSLLNCESDSQQDLSSFIQLFKRALITAELISLTNEKGNSACTALGAAWEIVEQFTKLTIWHTRGRPTEVDQMTFSRFLSRLIEIIANCKIKYRYTSSHSHDEPLESFLKQVEGVVRSSRQFQGRGSFSMIIGLTKLALLKYCNSMIGSLNSTGLCEEGDEMSMQVIDKIKEQFIKVRQIQKTSAPRIFFLIANSETQKRPQTILQQQRQSHHFLSSQTFSEVRKRFDRYSGMDLDFSFFRSSYFQAKSHYDSFYHDYLTRNHSLQSILKAYHQDFQDYTKRRQAKSLRKVKEVRTNTNSSSKTINVRNQERIRLPKSETTGVSTPKNKTIGRVPISMSLNSNKTKPRLSNSNNYPETDVKDNNESDRHSKQPFQSSHQYLALALTNTNSKLDRENLQKEPHKSLLRMHTETDKRKIKKELALGYEIINDNSVKEKPNRGFLTSVGKVSLKTKYFELKCLPEVLQETSMRNRMIFNHQFCIKHANRNKSRNWFDKKVE